MFALFIRLESATTTKFSKPYLLTNSFIFGNTYGNQIFITAFCFSATTILVVPERIFFFLIDIVKKPFAYPITRVRKDTKYCLSISYKICIFLSDEVRRY